MACPAIIAVFDLILLMAFQTPPHLKRRHPFYTRHGWDVTVAITALAARLYVPFMRKIDKIREIMHLFPRHGFFFVPVRGEFFYLGRIGLYNLMASHAPLHIRGTRDPRPVDIDMAVHAGYGIIPGVYLVAEVDGLHGGKIRQEGGVYAVANTKGYKEDNGRYDKLFQLHGAVLF